MSVFERASVLATWAWLRSEQDSWAVAAAFHRAISCGSLGRYPSHAEGAYGLRSILYPKLLSSYPGASIDAFCCRRARAPSDPSFSLRLCYVSRHWTFDRPSPWCFTVEEGWHLMHVFLPLDSGYFLLASQRRLLMRQLSYSLQLCHHLILSHHLRRDWPTRGPCSR